MQVWHFYSSVLRWRTHCFAAGTRRRPRPVRLVPGSLLGSSLENSVTGHRCKPRSPQRRSASRTGHLRFRGRPRGRAGGCGPARARPSRKPSGPRAA